VLSGKRIDYLVVTDFQERQFADTQVLLITKRRENLDWSLSKLNLDRLQRFNDVHQNGASKWIFNDYNSNASLEMTPKVQSWWRLSFCRKKEMKLRLHSFSPRSAAFFSVFWRRLLLSIYRIPFIRDDDASTGTQLTVVTHLYTVKLAPTFKTPVAVDMTTSLREEPPSPWLSE